MDRPGYEAALVAAQLDAEVTVVEADGAGGACVLSDCVPSKTFIASSDVVTAFRHGGSLGRTDDRAGRRSRWTPPAVHARVKRLALAQSADIAAKLVKAGVELVAGPGPARRRTRSATPTRWSSSRWTVTPYTIDADARADRHRRAPAESCPAPSPDGERILDLARGLRPARAAGAA